jgi:hypothetical protein
MVGDHAPNREDAERDQHEVIEITEHRNRIGDQVDRAEGIGDDAARQGLCVPGHARIADGEVERVNFAFQKPGLVRPSQLASPEISSRSDSLAMFEV